jgi:hypothetical protein
VHVAALADDPGQEQQQGQAGAEHRRADVVHDGDAGARGEGHERPVGAGVERQQDPVVQHDRGQEPHDHPRQRRVVEDDRRRVPGHRDAQQQDRGSQGAAEPAAGGRRGDVGHQVLRNSMARTHFVQRTPGSAGTTIRAG